MIARVGRGWVAPAALLVLGLGGCDESGVTPVCSDAARNCANAAAPRDGGDTQDELSAPVDDASADDASADVEGSDQTDHEPPPDAADDGAVVSGTHSEAGT